MKLLFAALLIGVSLSWTLVEAGSGYLIDPPSRSSMWRLPEFSGPDTPVNYDDMSLDCGSGGAQWVNIGFINSNKLPTFLFLLLFLSFMIDAIQRYQSGPLRRMRRRVEFAASTTQ